ncbi:MAG: GAF domain-containing protein [Chloroflexi bacterium]|nr:GAF domain-containing protein [Chloroflexota bacterium]
MNWRENILNAILRGTFLFSLLAFAGGINNVVQSYQENLDTPEKVLLSAGLLLALYAAAIFIVGFVTFKSTLPYSVRALTLLFVFYAVGIIGLYFSALSGDGRIFLFSACALTAILFDRRGAILALSLTISTLIIAAICFVTGLIQIPALYRANSTDPTAWLSGILVYTLLSTAAVISIIYLVRSLEESLLVAQREQREIQRSEKYYRALIENSSDAVALLNPEGIVLYASPSTWRVIGYNADEFVGQYAFAYVHPDDVSDARDFFSELFQTPGRVLTTGYRVKSKEGEWRWLEGSVHNLLHEPGIEAFVINYRDITHRRQSQAALQESETRLQRLNGVLRIIMEINQLIVREQDRQALLDQVCQLLIRHREYAFTWIGLLDEAGTMCRFAAASSPVNPEIYTFKLNSPNHKLNCVANALRGRVPLTISPETCSQCPALTSPAEHTSLALPIMRGEHTLGIWVVYANHSGLFDHEEITLLQQLANDLAYALENLLIEQQRRRRAEQQQTLAETAATILSQLDLDRLLMAVTEAARKTLHADHVALYQYDPERDRVTCPFSWGLSAEYVDAVNHQFRNIPGFSILSNLEPIAISDIREDARTSFLREHMLREGFLSYVVFPLHAPEYPLGGLTIYRDQTSQFTAGDLATGQTLAHLIAVALQNVQLFNKLEKRANEAETLRQVGAVVAATLERDQTIQLILQQLAQVVPFDSASVQLLGDGYLEIVGGRGLSDIHQIVGLRFPIPGNNPNTLVVQEKRPHIVALVTDQHGTFDQSPHTHIRSWLGVPLMVREQLIGMLSVDSAIPEFFTNEHARFVTAFGDQVAVALENARLFEETRRRASEMAALIELSTVLRLATTHDEMQKFTLDYALELLEVEEGAILAPLPHVQGLQVVESRRWAKHLRELTYKLDNSIAGHVFTSGKPLVSTDFTQETRALSEVSQFLKKNGSRAGIFVPLRSGNETIGVLCVDTPQNRVFDTDEVHLLTAIAEIAGSAIHRATVMETLEQRVRERTVELTQANEQLQELDRLKDEFVTNVNHELRTPLTNIMMYLDLLHTRGAQFLDRYLPVLRRESKRLTQLLEDMLTLSRLEQGQVSFKPEPQILDSLLTEVFQTYEARIRAKSLMIQYEPNPQIPAVLVDRAQMVQVFTNLVGNAVAYTPERGRIECHFSWAKDGMRYVELVLHNTGTSVPPEELPHLFERFYRGKTGRDSGEPGTGLGLAICQEIVARHGGHITGESDEVNGTTFRLQLPAF